MAQYTFKARDIWADIMRDCAAAQSSIEIEQYILMDDTIGQLFLKLLRDKAAAGVKVRLLLDSVGSRSVTNHQLIEELRQLGARVQIYNRMHFGNLFTPQRWFPRNHAKTAMIDGRIFHIGSSCMADDMADWEEAHVRIEGEIIKNIEQDFIYTPEKPNNGYEYLRSRPGRRNPIYQEMMVRIRSAKNSVYMMTPYFMPPILLKRALITAAKRGVDVRILVAARPDVAVAGIVGQTYFEKMRKKGINIYLYEPAMLHSKCMVVDGNWAMVGSANLDYLSLLRNREANLVIDDDTVVAKLADHFNELTIASRLVDASFWQQVPWPEKMLGYLGRLAKKVL